MLPSENPPKTSTTHKKKQQYGTFWNGQTPKTPQVKRLSLPVGEARSLRTNFDKESELVSGTLTISKSMTKKGAHKS